MSLKREHSLEYNSWKAMHARCYNPRSTSYEYAGGRPSAVVRAIALIVVAPVKGMQPRRAQAVAERYAEVCA